MYNYVCMYVCCLPPFTIAHSTFILEPGGTDCTRNGKAVSLLIHLKHKVFQFFSPILKALLPVPLEVLDTVLHRNFS